MFGQKNKNRRVSKDDIKSSVLRANKRFQNANDKIQKEVSGAKDALKGLKADAKATQKQIDMAYNKVTSYKSQISSNLKTLDKSRRDLNASLDRLSRSLDEEKCVEQNISALKKEETKFKKSVTALEKRLLERDGLAVQIKNAKAEYSSVKKELQILQGEMESARTDSVAVRSAKDSLEAEFDALKEKTDRDTVAIQESIDLSAALQKLKETEHAQKMKSLDAQMTEKQQEADDFIALAEKSKGEYINIQGALLSAEKRIEKAEEESTLILKRREDGIGRIKERYETWKLNELDKVAKMKLKGKIENIDKAGLKEILDA